MQDYFRPIAQTDAHRPMGALSLAGGADVWFTQVEHVRRDGTRALLPAVELPDTLASRLTAPRALFVEPTLMGVLNTTPDSFSDGGRFAATPSAVAYAQAMVSEGAGILDIGGESTRPGAAFVPAEEEIARVVPVISAIRAAGIKVPISVDTRKADVAQAALEAGATMLNDVSALSFDAGMAEVAARSGAPICLMHAQGDPKTMQDAPHYDNVVLDVYDHLADRIAVAEAAGIARDKIIIDPGIGFGKTQAHNLALIQNICLFHGLGCTLLLGVSRKRFIGTIGKQPQADLRGPGSLAVAIKGLMQGVQITRAHDIEMHAQGFALWRAVNT